MARKTHGDEWWAKHPEVVRCTARLTSTGEQCRTEAHLGTTVCFKHGANLPAVQAAAARRIGNSVEDAVERLQRMLDDPQVEAREKVKILHDLLDRAGLGATSKVLVGVAEVDPIESLFRDILADPDGLAPPQVIQAQQPEPLSLNRAEDLDDFEDLIGPVDIVEAELVEEVPAPAPSTGRKPRAARNKSREVPPPKHIREDLERLGLL